MTNEERIDDVAVEVNHARVDHPAARRNLRTEQPTRRSILVGVAGVLQPCHSESDPGTENRITERRLYSSDEESLRPSERVM